MGKYKNPTILFVFLLGRDIYEINLRLIKECRLPASVKAFVVDAVVEEANVLRELISSVILYNSFYEKLTSNCIVIQ